MRLIIPVVTGICLICLISCSVGSDKASNKPGAGASDVRVIKALYVPSAGFAWKNDEGELTGFTIELIRDFWRYTKEKHDGSVELIFEEETDWRTFYNRIRDGGENKIGMGNVTITEDRQRELHFSPAYMNNIASLISHPDAPHLERLEDLSHVFEGRKALAFEGTLHERRLRELLAAHYPEAILEMAHSNDEILQMVAASDEYFAFIDLYNYQRGLGSGLHLKHHSVADQSEEQFGFILPLNSIWLNSMKDWFEAGGGLVNSEGYRQLMKEHLGEQLTKLLLSDSEKGMKN